MIRTDQLRTKREAFRAFVASTSGRVALSGVVVASVVRVVVAAWSWIDLGVVAVTAGAVGIVEWTIHLFLLHAPPDAWTSRRLGTGSGHRQHHLDPPAIEFLLLRGIDAVVFSVLIVIATALWTMPAAALAGTSVLATWLTGCIAAIGALAHYEWTHLLVHTRYRPRTRYYARLARNHRSHHYRNERYWLGVTSNLGDRMLRTYPRSRSEVELSVTARTLQS